MKKTLCTLVAGICFACAITTPNLASAVPVLQPNQTIRAVFGAGNPDWNWNAVYDPSLGVQLGLRAKNRIDGTAPNDGLGTYSFLSGTPPGPVRNIWNWEFSINTDTATNGVTKLTAYEFYLTADGPGWSPGTINLMTAFADNSYGDNNTANGAGMEGLFSTYGPILNIAQNSQNGVFSGANPYAEGDYHFRLFATQVGAGPTGSAVLEVGMTVHVVPEPSSLALVGIGSLAVMSGIRRRR